ncbi:type VI secretion system tube protein TssD [Anaeromyxobacter oryzisoli]|jgi:type VI secretion system secreted protein Hcp|uniref:type VI secretion system tube protein TssD n=1 Tax=Anaeromyxobacter oryzisoli TaxID=2925408 RepID=UPI001F58D3F9|nr:type VI secretion system tube protein TssD [Anaeromyxobacter sp. SG63]
MAQTVHLFLKANGKDVKGESTQTSLGREGSIECISYEQAVKTAREEGTNMVTGRRQHQPIKIVKRIDQSSPLIMKALTENQKVEAVFKFYRPNPSGDGTTEQFYTVQLKEANVSAVKQEVPDTIAKDTAGLPPLEQIEFVFKEIIWRFEKGGVEHPDKW